MTDDTDDLEQHIRNVRRLPVPDEPTGDAPDASDYEAVQADSSAPDVLDLRAQERDAAALARDRAAEARVRRTLEILSSEQLDEERMLVARDRAAAALDRHEAALDRHRAATYLKRTYRDEITGALQRDSGRDRLSQELERVHRSGDSLIIAFLDVVQLKQVNDERGHRAGDDLLRAVGASLSGGLRAYDVVVRYGGDEFVCALPHTDLAAAARRFAEVSRLLTAASPGARVSVGLAELTDGETLDSVVHRADRDMFEGRQRAALPQQGRAIADEP